MGEHTWKHHEKNPKYDEVREHMKAAREAMRKSVQAWLPEGVLENHRTARREFLKAMRSLVDVALEHTESDVKSGEPEKREAEED